MKAAMHLVPGTSLTQGLAQSSPQYILDKKMNNFHCLWNNSCILSYTFAVSRRFNTWE